MGAFLFLKLFYSSCNEIYRELHVIKNGVYYPLKIKADQI